jgi:hypothetical protein
MRAKGRSYEWDRVVANNAEEFPDPKLPTYEGFSEWAEGSYVTRHVSVRRRAWFVSRTRRTAW